MTIRHRKTCGLGMAEAVSGKQKLSDRKINMVKINDENKVCTGRHTASFEKG